MVPPAEPALRVEVPAKVETPVKVEAPVEVPVKVEVSVPAVLQPLVTGPDRYELPATFRHCASAELFCGVQILDLASKKTVTLVTRDQAKTWVVRAGKKETPVTVSFVDVPVDPRVIWRTTNLFYQAAMPVATVPATGLELWHDVAAVAGDKTYAIARKDAYEKIFLYAIEADGKHLPVKLGSSVDLVYPYREGLALYTGGKGDAIELYDPVKGKVYDRIPVVSDIDRECAKIATETEPGRMIVLAEQGRAYVEFECTAIGA